MPHGKLERVYSQLHVTRLSPERCVGLVVVLTGHGKGKTSSALGMLVRACGHGMKICMIQFMKGDLYTGEWDGVRNLCCQVELIPAGMGFCGIRGNPFSHEEHRVAAQHALDLAAKKLSSGKYDMVILDEINNALNLGLLDLQQVIDLVQGKPLLTHLILTGRDAHPRIIDLADTASEVRELKHAYRQGIEPQPGVDF